jgi:hypothetical protein
VHLLVLIISDYIRIIITGRSFGDRNLNKVVCMLRSRRYQRDIYDSEKEVGAIVL